MFWKVTFVESTSTPSTNIPTLISSIFIEMVRKIQKILRFISLFAGLYSELFASGYTSDWFGGKVGNHFLMSECRLIEDEQEINLKAADMYRQRIPLVCFKSKVDMEYTALSRSTKASGFESRRFRGYGYMGLFLPWRFSLHSAASVEEAYHLIDDDEQYRQRQETERLFLQWGRTGVDVWSLKAGRLHGLFGLNDLLYPYIQRSLYTEPEKFFEHNSFGWTITKDTLQSEMYELSILSTHPEFFKKDQRETISSDESEESEKIEETYRNTPSILFRSSFDVGVFEGLRMVYSFLGNERDAKRYGVGIMVDSGGNNRASLEWVRDYPEFEADSAYSQIIDFTVRNSQSTRVHSVFSIQSIQGEYLRVEVGMRNIVPHAGYFDLSLDYFNFRDDRLGEALAISLGATVRL